MGRWLKGHPASPARPGGQAPGWHPVEWLCEAGGTGFQLFFGFSAVALFESPYSPLHPDLPGWARFVVIGSCFGILGAMVAVSPLGRRSGAHLNPSVTLGFVLRGHTSVRDAAGFVAGQTVGALGAAALFAEVWGRWATSVDTARTAPAAGMAAWAAAGIEAGLTSGLILVIFTMLSSARTARWTPVVLVGAVAGLILLGAPRTGASLNPARTAGPDIVTALYPAVWAYMVGPPAGAVVAVALFDLVARGRRTLTAKLFHDPAYPSVHASTLPARPHPGTSRPAPAAAAERARPAVDPG